MECRKARYYLVTSFDGPLDPETKRQLGYHLKDCRACRHESFYYRELFSATRQVDELTPGSDFNERLVAQIRLREAQAGWPNRTTRPARKRKLTLFLAPGLFTAAAALAFVFFIEPTQSRHQAGSPGIANPGPAPRVEATSAAISPGDEVRPSPRYAPVLVARSQFQIPQEIFRVRYPVTADAPGVDDFERLVRETLGVDNVLTLPKNRPQERINFVLPVVEHGKSPEIVY